MVLFLFSGPLAAQTVQGTLRNATDSAVVPGALVLLLDTAGVEQGRAVSYASGRYALRAPRPGTYQLRVLRIGSRPFTSPRLHLAAQEVLGYQVLLPRSPIVLSEIIVTSDAACRPHPDAERGMSTVWEEVRKALAITVETMQHGPYRFATQLRRETFDPNMLLIGRDSFPGPQLDQWPVRGLAPGRLAAQGYVQAGHSGNGATYYGVDPAVLFSRSFLDRHCFHLVRNRADSALIGLAFEPAGRPPRPDVEGTLWLSRADARLRYLEWTYTGLANWVPREKTGGRLDFMRLANGAWLVRQWWMRAPVEDAGLRVSVLQDRRRVDRRSAVAGWVLEGGRVTEVRDENGGLLQTVEALPGR